MTRSTARGWTLGKAALKSTSRTASPSWKLYFIIDDAEFEADFVVARTVAGAKRVFSNMYGGDVGCTVDLVTEIENPPAWLKQSVWLGPDAEVLEELGGKRLASIDFPRWQFGDRVWGYPKTIAERYRFPPPESEEP